MRRFEVPLNTVAQCFGPPGHFLHQGRSIMTWSYSPVWRVRVGECIPCVTRKSNLWHLHTLCILSVFKRDDIDQYRSLLFANIPDFSIQVHFALAHFGKPRTARRLDRSVHHKQKSLSNKNTSIPSHDARDFPRFIIPRDYLEVTLVLSPPIPTGHSPSRSLNRESPRFRV